ncbi:MAG: FliA/WhiG family RNA polymerase sigma factor [Nitrospirota bacterium]|uniref:RNA polymerase sigma factor n=1 Tax=Candidatus Magnetominusculus xianensis TaxID=1748249 RepID=A0ABR5SE59_9BACT|nr:FliA/WhiG family RNA polymerase sigma factor [Candidatus Magnetominusculus xianensis]KWT84083.1 RNA polymerase sigma factor [Candidatus Magnetominusculus xianensis]MBF0402376.1 FliA/WhiG family RNA polymerase sigma factor [Nitrospirota bacterium]
METKKYKSEISDEKKEEVIKDFLPFIKYTAFRLSHRLPPQLTSDDLISVGVIGLLDSLDNYDQTRAKLKTYAEFRIKGAMLDEIRAFDTSSRSLKEKVNELKDACVKLEKELCRPPDGEEVAKSLNISLDDYFKILKDADSVITLRFEDFGSGADNAGDMNLMDNIPDDTTRDPLRQLVDASQKELLAALIAALPKKEKMVLSLYYWDELTMKEIGKVLSLSEGRVCQLHSQAILRLKGKLKAGIGI